MSVYARYKKQRKLRGCMRKLSFAPYEKVEEGQPQPQVVTTWGLLFQALNNNPRWSAGEDTQKIRATAKLLDKLDAVQVATLTPEGARQTRLKYEGGDVLLEDAEFAQLEDAWRAFRSQLPASLAREIVHVIDFLNKAPTVETKEAK